jgi:acetolactate decarboxylase
MSLKKYLLPGIIITVILFLALFHSNPISLDNNNSLFQVSTMNSLSAGNFDGNISTGELKMHGNTGMGTFNGLDGEMIELNGIIYQVKSSGAVYAVNDSELIPFAMVTYFQADKILILNKSMNYTELQEYLNAIIPSKDISYSFKVMGTFDYIKARSPKEQYKPYPNLTEALKTQSIFNFNDINGTMVGFWYPAYASSLNLNDYHFHFIDEKKNSGGHVLDLKLKNVIVEIDYIPDIYLFSPEKDDFIKFNLTNN